MSTHTKAAEEIKRAWLTAWTAAGAPFPVEHENHRFKQPASGPWGRLSLQTGNTEPASIGKESTAMDRTPFILTLQVFLPENSGTNAAYAAADSLRPMNRMTARIDGLTVYFRSVGITQGNNPANTGLAAFNIAIPGNYDLTPVPTP